MIDKCQSPSTYRRFTPASWPRCGARSRWGCWLGVGVGRGKGLGLHSQPARPVACGWLTDRFGLCWQIVPENIGEILKQPKAMAAMMKMVKLDIATLEAAAKE